MRSVGFLCPALAMLLFAAPIHASAILGSFCEAPAAVELAKRDTSHVLWNAAEVQSYVGALVAQDGIKCTPQSAYVVAYKSMTAERDRARCTVGHAMRPTTPLAVRLNDALSDVMTRQYVNVWSMAAKGQASGADVGSLWLNLFNDAKKGNFNSIHMAMASTGLYLTTHMGLAVSALVHADPIWEGTDLVSLEARAKKVEEVYREAYDAFNPFLAENLKVVENALTNSRLTTGAKFSLATRLASSLSMPVERIFHGIRTSTFDLGLALALVIPRDRHPLTEEIGGKYVLKTAASIPAGALPPSSKQLTDLIAHGAFWRRGLGDALGPFYKFMGGLDFGNLREASVYHAECMKDGDFPMPRTLTLLPTALDGNITSTETIAVQNPGDADVRGAVNAATPSALRMHVGVVALAAPLLAALRRL